MDVPQKTALVVEGGGMRGVFAAGILDCFIEKNFSPFDSYFGVSAGACNLASYLAGQYERNYRCYSTHMLDPRFFSLSSFLCGGHYMDLDWFWDHLSKVDPLDQKKATAKEFYIVATNVDSGAPICIRATPFILYDLLKGSSALPLLYRHFVEVCGLRLIDGGVTNSIPIKDAVEKGATRIMVLRSQPKNYLKKSFLESKVIPLLFLRYPKLKKALALREKQYNETLEFINHPPAGIEIIEISPESLHSGRTTKNKEYIEADYQEGKKKALEAIARWSR